MYKQYKNIFGELANGILRIQDNTFIPFVLANNDYQQYLIWLEEGNTPLPAEENI